MVGITSEQIERVESILNGVQRGPEKVFFNVINRALRFTQSSKRICGRKAISS